MFIEHKKHVEKQMMEIKSYLERIDYKVWYYTTHVMLGLMLFIKKANVMINIFDIELTN